MSIFYSSEHYRVPGRKGSCRNDLRRFGNFVVNFAVDYIEADYTVNFAVNWLDSDVLPAMVSVHDKVHDVVEESV